MKKYYKSFKTRHMTVETMANCTQKCLAQKCDCSSACGGSMANGAVIVGTVGTIDYNLMAIGTAY